MTLVNETVSYACTFLDDRCFSQLYHTFIEAFSDYVFPFALTEEQFRNHIILNAVDLNRTAGCVEDGELVGFSLNGFGDWNGKATVYDAGTGVIPRCRRRGLSEAMFEMMLPVFERDGIEQFLLEVVTTNTGAIRLYEKLGFATTREFALLQCDRTITLPEGLAKKVEVRQLEEPDWDVFLEFWSGDPSWQNSVKAIDRSKAKKRIVAAYIDGECAGYVIFSSHFGRIAQIAVDPRFAGRGVGTRLVHAVQEATAPGYSLQVINADKALTDVNKFFTRLGFYERLAQYEMLRPL